MPGYSWFEKVRVRPGVQETVDDGRDELVVHQTPRLHKFGVLGGHHAQDLLSVKDLKAIHRVVYGKGT